MANLKRYNKTTDKWEDIVSQFVVYSGSPTHYCEILTDKPSESDGECLKLDEVIKDMEDDITTLQGNVAWLAKHGIGGGGGGSQPSTYSIDILSPISDNILTISSNPFTLGFRVIGGPSSEKYQYKITSDGIPVNSTAQFAYVGSNVYVDVNLNEKVSNHSLVIDVTDPNGLSISCTLKVIETSISISMGNAENATKPAILAGTLGTVNIYVTNKILNAKTILSLKNETLNTEPYIYEYTSQMQSETPIPINLINNVIPIGSHFKPGATYNIKVTAQTYAGTEIINSNEIDFTAIVYGKDEITFIVNGLATEEEHENIPENTPNYGVGELLSFSFRMFLTTTEPIYFAVKLVTNDGVRLINGNYYDSTLNNGSNLTYKDNDYRMAQYTAYCKWAIPANFNIQDGATIFLKAWSSNGKYVKESAYKFNIVQSNNEIFDNQIPTRVFGGNTLLFSWNKENIPTNNNPIWESNVSEYVHIDGSRYEAIKSQLSLVHVNNVISGILNNPNIHLRLQNNAYASGDTSSYESILNELITNNINKDGFSVSITFETDIHPYKNRTVFLMGENSSNGELLTGMRIDLNEIVWIIPGTNDNKYTLSVNIKQGEKYTVIFNYLNGIAKIFVNGIVNKAKDIRAFDNSYKWPTKFYLGCNYYNKTVTEYSDVSIYNLSIFGKGLNDLECVVNSYNNNLNDDITSQDVIDKYKKWKANNFFKSIDVENPKTPVSTLFDGGKYLTPSFKDIKDSNPPIPVMCINGDSTNVGFSADYFYKVTNAAIEPKVFSGFTMEYYDPNGSNTESIEYHNVCLSIQGTSSTTYRAKNLEIYFRDEIGASGNNKYKLFQPRKDWFPESQFTLKADVVDSSHALNASIGEWINTYGSKVMEENPAMLAVKQNPPRDTYTGEEQTSDNKGSKLSVKHTLEGFPFILLINFGGNDLRLIGIYSFNLGRFSHYNMGFKFLKNFTRRENENATDKGCPSIVYDYTEYDASEPIKLEDGSEIKQNQIFSFEFNSDADNNSAEHPTWSQDDITILKHIGEFKYNGITRDNQSVPDDSIWEECLKPLFTAVATMGNIDYPAQSEYKWDETNKSYTATGGIYRIDENAAEKLKTRLSVRNAYAYYVIAIALGLIDSLGKNFVVRSWNADPNNGKTTKWWPAFYDMDSACGGSNDGSENVPETAYIDKYANSCTYQYIDSEGITHETDNYLEIPFDENNNRYKYTTITDETKPNKLIIYRNVRSENSNGFGAYNLRLWNILRSNVAPSLITDIATYEKIWGEIRNSYLTTSDRFVDIMVNKMGNCGELLYNQDYTEKYITSANGSYGNINMLHGTRFERIRQWLSNRFYFLDGVFAIASNNNVNMPYYNRGTFYYGGTFGKAHPKLTFNVISPCILEVETGQNGEYYKYYLEPYEDNVVIMPELGSDNKATSINNLNLITGIGNLVSNNFNKFGDNIILPIMSEINLPNVNTLGLNPIDFSKVFLSNNEGIKTSHIRTIDLHNTESSDSNSYTVNLYAENSHSYDKVNYIDISNSNITSLSLPKSPLSYLKINNSLISSITLSNQPFLNSISFDSCSKLMKISISDCSQFKEIKVQSLGNIQNVEIRNCGNIENIVITDNPSLKEVIIDNLSSLRSITISNCINQELKIRILDCYNIEKMDFSNNNISLITLPTKVDNVIELNLTNCVSLESFQYGDGSEIEDGVLDLSPFTKLNSESEGFHLRNNHIITKLRVRNIKDCPFALYDKLETNENLSRIYGNISIKNTEVFNNCRNFFLNDNIQEEGVTKKPDPNEFIEDNYFCNITDLPESLENAFTYTKCNLFDVYYVLSKCTDKVTNLRRAFAFCGEIETNDSNPLWENLFANCGSVETIEGLFFEVKTINGPLSNKLLTPLVKITGFDYVFGNSTKYRIGDVTTPFFGEEVSGITSIVNFNPLSNNNANTGINFDDNLLSNLTELETINSSFNGCAFEFAPKGECNLFKNNKKLKTIINSFNTTEITHGSFKNIFGGNMEMTTDYPQELETISGSFNVPESATQFDNTIEESIFKHLKNTIKYVNGTRSFDYSFGIKKINSTFPYEIFKNCPNLEDITGFFYGLKSNSQVEINFPNGMFDGCPNLLIIDRLFANIKEENGIKINLNGFGLKNNSITSLCELFSGSSINTSIPLGLLYQSDSDGNIIKCITNMSGIFKNAKFKDGTHYVTPTSSELTDENWEIVENMDSSLKSDGYDENYHPVYDNLSSYNNNFDINDYKLLSSSYYLCPPDLFYYCKNSNETNITSALSTTDGYIYTLGQMVGKKNFGSGLLGRIPENLLTPVNMINSIESLFEGIPSLLPYTWDNLENMGEMYPPKLFDGFQNLNTAAYTFKNTPIWYGTAVPIGFFDTIAPTLISMKGLWNGVAFGGAYDGKYQIPYYADMTGYAMLSDVSEMFSQSSIVQIQSLISIFTPSLMPRLSNVNTFMYECTSATASDLPALWDPGFSAMSSRYNAYVGMTPDKFPEGRYDELKEKHPAFFNGKDYA